MLSSVLAAVTCVAIPVTDPLQIPAQTIPGAAAVEVGAHVTPTTFRGRNFSGVEQLFVFGNTDHSVAPIVVVVPPSGVVDYEFAPHALEGVLLEVVSVRDGQLATSGAHPLALPVMQPDMCLWTLYGNSEPAIWQQLGCELTHLPAGASLLPDVGADAPGSESALAPPCAVPVSPPRVPPPGTNLPYSPL